MKPRVLIAEDERGMVLMLQDRLTACGYEVSVAGNGPDAVRVARSNPFDLIVLDIMMPGMDGLEVCRELRRLGVATPILMLTALGDVVDRVVGLRTGADDYLTKPFEMIELQARIEALLRRSGPKQAQLVSTTDPFVFGQIEVRFLQVEVLRAGEPVQLTARMFELLRFFIQRRGEVLTRNEILDGVWHPDSMPSERTVDVHVAWLRQRLEVQPSRPQHLLTVRGFGYKFVAESD